MSQHMFGVGRKQLSVAKRKQIRAIAAANGADFVNVNLPGDGWKYWFTCPNLGFPFDRATEQGVYAALEAAGIELP